MRRLRFGYILTALLLLATSMTSATGSFAIDTASLQALPRLAARALGSYTDPERMEYLDARFRLEICAGRYADALRSLDTLCFLMDDEHIPQSAIGLAYQVYAQVMLDGATDRDFDSVYAREIRRRLRLLPVSKHGVASGFFEMPIEDREQRLRSMLDGRTLSDSTDVSTIVGTCKAYCSYNVCRRTLDIGRRILREVEAEHFTVNDSVVLRMKDGGEVSLSYARSAKSSAPLPVILTSSIYPGGDLARCKEAVSSGYVGVVMNTRGKRLSTSSIEPFEHDADDIHEVIEWIAAQPWCNGSVGMYGGSYLGFSQWAAAKRLHPALKTIVPQVAVGAGIDFPMHNGIMMNYSMSWLRYVTETKMTAASVFDDEERIRSNNRLWYAKGLRFRALDSLNGTPNPLFQRWLDHPVYDGFWQAMTPQKAEFASIDIPVLTTTGYYDDDQMGALHYVREHRKWNADAKHYLFIGPYDHAGGQSKGTATLGNYDVDSVARISITDLVFRWFDHVLKDSAFPSQLKDKVTYQVMGANEWRGAPSLDAMAKRTVTLYPVFDRKMDRKMDRQVDRLMDTNHSSDTMTLKIADSGVAVHGLTRHRPLRRTSYVQTVDLHDRSDTDRWQDNDVFGVFPMMVDTLLHVMPGRMVFASEPMDEDCIMSGGVDVSAVLRTNKRDLDIVVDVLEQLPDGRFMPLMENLQRASLAADRSQRRLLTPDSICTIPVTNTFVTCKKLRKGSRIVILMGVHKTPVWQINYGSGKDVSEETIDDAGEPMRVEWFNDTRIHVGMDE
ncbi:MAG: CocE/NonD family hydrolase [Candidatus Kapaibacterium sp.]